MFQHLIRIQSIVIPSQELYILDFMFPVFKTLNWIQKTVYKIIFKMCSSTKIKKMKEINDVLSLPLA